MQTLDDIYQDLHARYLKTLRELQQTLVGDVLISAAVRTHILMAPDKHFEADGYIWAEHDCTSREMILEKLEKLIIANEIDLDWLASDLQNEPLKNILLFDVSKATRDVLLAMTSSKTTHNTLGR